MFIGVPNENPSIGERGLDYTKSNQQVCNDYDHLRVSKTAIERRRSYQGTLSKLNDECRHNSKFLNCELVLISQRDATMEREWAWLEIIYRAYLDSSSLHLLFSLFTLFTLFLGVVFLASYIRKRFVRGKSPLTKLIILILLCITTIFIFFFLLLGRSFAFPFSHARQKISLDTSQSIKTAIHVNSLPLRSSPAYLPPQSYSFPSLMNCPSPASQICIFSTLRPMKEKDIELATIQRNAALSWRGLGKDVEIIFVGEGSGISEIASLVNATVVPFTEEGTTPDGKPLLRYIISKGYEYCTAPFLFYTNSDIVYSPYSREGMIAAVNFHQKQYGCGSFLGMGTRLNIVYNAPLLFSPNWELPLALAPHFKRFQTSAQDYFFFDRTFFNPRGVPNYVLSAPSWDNWICAQGHLHHVPVYDLSHAVTAYHMYPTPKDFYDSHASHRTRWRSNNDILTARDNKSGEKRTGCYIYCSDYQVFAGRAIMEPRMLDDACVENSKGQLLDEWEGGFYRYELTVHSGKGCPLCHQSPHIGNKTNTIYKWRELKPEDLVLLDAISPPAVVIFWIIVSIVGSIWIVFLQKLSMVFLKRFCLQRKTVNFRLQ